MKARKWRKRRGILGDRGIRRRKKNFYTNPNHFVRQQFLSKSCITIFIKLIVGLNIILLNGKIIVSDDDYI